MGESICQPWVEIIKHGTIFAFVLFIVEKSSGVDKSGMWVWETVGKVRYAVKGDVLQIEVPRKIIKMTGREISFNFKWSDNMQQDGNIMDFYLNRDVAPGGRFMFHFEAHEVLFHNVDSTSSSIMLYIITVFMVVLAIVLGVVVIIIRRKTGMERNNG